MCGHVCTYVQESSAVSRDIEPAQQYEVASGLRKNFRMCVWSVIAAQNPQPVGQPVTVAVYKCKGTPGLFKRRNSSRYSKLYRRNVDCIACALEPKVTGSSNQPGV